MRAIVARLLGTYVRLSFGDAAGRGLLRSDARTNTVVVGPRESLARTSVRAKGNLYVPVDRAQVKLRYRSPAVAAAVVETGDGFRLELDAPAFGVAAGQAAVLYDGEAVVGAGVIARAE